MAWRVSLIVLEELSSVDFADCTDSMMRDSVRSAKSADVFCILFEAATGHKALHGVTSPPLTSH